jgi:hypothetical protein
MTFFTHMLCNGSLSVDTLFNILVSFRSLLFVMYNYGEFSCLILQMFLYGSFISHVLAYYSRKLVILSHQSFRLTFNLMKPIKASHGAIFACWIMIFHYLLLLHL